MLRLKLNHVSKRGPGASFAETSSICIEFRPWMSNHIHLKIWKVIIFFHTETSWEFQLNNKVKSMDERVIIMWMWSSENLSFSLTHCGLVKPYGDINLCQHWLKQWLVAWQHQAITWTNVDLSSLRTSGIHLRAILQEIHQPSVT